MKYLKLIGLIISLLSAAFVLQPVYADPPLPTPVGRVVWIKGSLKATMPNNEQRLLQKMSVIYLSDILSTDQASQAQVVFSDNTLLTFRPSTTLSIDKYEFKPSTKKGSVGTYVMSLVEGGFRTITGLIAHSNPSDYKVNTPVATIGVRGTDYAVYFHSGQLSMAYYTGSPCLSNKQGTLCLTTAVPFGSVSIGGAPVALTTQPAVFKEKLDVVPVKITPFVSSVGGGPTSYSTQHNTSGPITSFCISQ